MSKPTLPQERVRDITARLSGTSLEAPEAHAAAPRGAHVAYGGAHLFSHEVHKRMGRTARRSLDRHAGDAPTFGAVVGLRTDALADDLYARVQKKLETRPVEAYCIDFEDGFGLRSDADEDREATRTARELAQMLDDPSRPAVGIRVKALAAASARRAVRTLDIFLTTLAAERPGAVPDDFTVTLPKITSKDEVAALAETLATLEQELGLGDGSVGVELMIESPRALLDRRGIVALPALVLAAEGRCKAVHLGAYDLTAALGVVGPDQRLDHPACDVARMLMQISLAGSKVAVVDGATTILPVPTRTEEPLSADDQRVNDEVVRAAWRLHAANVRRSVSLGIMAGWDLHPAQLPARFGALHAFYLDERDAMVLRLERFVAAATKATRSGQAFDDAATAHALLGFFARGLDCGALDDADVARTGLTAAEVRRGSFLEILAARARGGDATKGSP